MNVKLIDTYLYHKGWVREPTALHEKIRSNIRLYRETLANEENEDTTTTNYEYDKDKFKRIIANWTGRFPGEYKNYKIAK